MATRDNLLQTATFTLHNGDTIEVIDDANAKKATSAIRDFLAGKTATLIDASDNKTLVPFHAVIKVEVSAKTDQTTYDDDTCRRP